MSVIIHWFYKIVKYKMIFTLIFVNCIWIFDSCFDVSVIALYVYWTTFLPSLSLLTLLYPCLFIYVCF